MNTATAANSFALNYLGPRLQAVYDVVATTHLKTVREVWPLARAGMVRQGIDVDDFALPTKKADVGPFKKSITARIKPAFTSSFVEINRMPREFIITVIRMERIELKALTTFIDAGLIDRKEGEKFIKSAYAYFEASTYEEHPLLPDLRTTHRLMHHFSDGWTDIKTEIRRIVETYAPFGIAQEIIEGIRRIMNEDINTFEAAIAVRAQLIFYMRPRVERKIFSDILRHKAYTPDEIEQIYSWGFISPPLYKLLHSLAAKKD